MKNQPTKSKGLNVLSLFDGFGGAKLALEQAGIKINKYYSSEICPHAIAVQNFHYSGDTNFIQLGDVCKIDAVPLASEIDLVIFGSPCTNLSSINPKERNGLEGTESKLFFEARRILAELYSFQPLFHKLYFMMENVASMSNVNRDIITYELSIIFPDLQYLKIDSAICAPAHRRRYYWSNIPNLTQPLESDITYSDIIENGFVDKDKANVLLGSSVTLTNGISRYYKMNIGNIIFKDEVFSKLTKEDKLEKYPALLKASGYVGKTHGNKDEYAFPNGVYRTPSILELERMMGVPDGFIRDVPSISKTNKKKMIGLGFTVPVIAHLLTPLKTIYTNE